VHRASAADEGELLLEGLTCTMNANSGVALRDSGSACEGLQTAFCEVQVAKYLGIGRFQCVGDLADALADNFTSPRIVPRFAL
jgi:hypothetical protein